MASLSKQFPAKTVIASESDPVAMQKLKTVDASIDKINTDIIELSKSAIAKFNDAKNVFITVKDSIPSNPLLTTIANDLGLLTTELNRLNLTKSSTDSINGLTGAVKGLNGALVLISDPVTQSNVDTINAQIAAVRAAIALTQSSLSEAESIRKLETELALINTEKASQADLIKINAALKLANDEIDKLKASGGTDLTAVNKAIADADTEIKALKVKQDATAESLQKATQSIADLALLVAKGGTGTGTTSTDLKTLQDKLAALETAKAEKTALDTLDKSVKDLTAALGSGATDAELAEAIKKVDVAIAAIESSLKPLLGKTVYTTATVLIAVVGDEIHIDGEGDIQLPTAPKDGAEVRIFDGLGKMKAGKNNVLLGAGDHWLIHDGTFAEGPMTFLDNQLQHGWIRLKYSTPTASWWPYIVYGVSTSTTKAN